MRLTMHVGAEKCGSSAIQAALTERPLLTTRTGDRVEYCAIRKGKLHRASDIPGIPTLSGAISSSGLKRDDTDGLMDALRRVLSLKHDVVLSCEGWLRNSARWAHFLSRLGVTGGIRVIVYVRPQVDYLNSAWWQWDAWSGRTLREALEKRRQTMRWTRRIEAWQRLDMIDEVIARPIYRDVVADFYELLDVAPPARGDKVNMTLPASALRMMQRHPDLRPDEHSNSADHVLPRIWTSDEPPPWVIDREMAEEIVANCRRVNLELADMLPERDRAAMLADPRWWDADAYSDRQVEPAGPIPAADPELDSMAAALLREAVERHVAQMEARWTPRNVVKRVLRRPARQS